MRLTVLVVFVLLSFGYVFSAVYFSPVYIRLINGKVVTFCQYGEGILLPGESYVDQAQCMNCVCSLSGLECQSFVERIIAPESSDCISVTVNCENSWVMRNNTNLSCPPDLIPKEFSAVGK